MSFLLETSCTVTSLLFNELWIQIFGTAYMIISKIRSSLSFPSLLFFFTNLSLKEFLTDSSACYNDLLKPSGGLPKSRSGPALTTGSETGC